jgi:hypothetical protein
MAEQQTDTGVIVALLERMRTQRLPRALDIKAKVDAGGTLDEYDLAFLDDVMRNAEDLRPVWEHHPELQEIIAKMVHLYHEITTKALANEGGPEGSTAPLIQGAEPL